MKKKEKDCPIELLIKNSPNCKACKKYAKCSEEISDEEYEKKRNSEAILCKN